MKHPAHVPELQVEICGQKQPLGAPVHVPLQQRVTKLGWLGHELLQPPQWLGSDDVLTHCPLQKVVPFGHAHAHAAVLNVCPPVHVEGTHCPLQSVVPIEHWQLPLTQTVGDWQTLPQPPQLLESVWVLTHCPLQRVAPVGQPQAPLTQFWPA